ACTVHLDGVAMRSCQLPVSVLAGRQIVTIEGLPAQVAAGGQQAQLHPVQEAWIAEQAPQCGYCQPGQIMSAAALLKRTPKPTDVQIDEAMAGNICRCATYSRMRKAIHHAAGQVEEVTA
ncbi:MAG TPA: (2Fe-2S)-binding protein, partial [Acidobacteriaceae bacterium]